MVFKDVWSRGRDRIRDRDGQNERAEPIAAAAVTDTDTATTDTTDTTTTTASPPNTDLLALMASGTIRPPFLLLNDPLINAMKATSEDERTEMAYVLMRSLPPDRSAGLLARFGFGALVDPVAALPAELTSRILSMVDPITAAAAMATSVGWNRAAVQPGLWRQFILTEGWKIAESVEMDVIQAIRVEVAAEKAREAAAAAAAAATTTTTTATTAPLATVDPNRSRLAGFFRPWQRVAGSSSGTDRMEDVPSDNDDKPTQSQEPAAVDDEQAKLLTAVGPMLTESSPRTINWCEVYRQRRRLEQNWTLGRFTNFQFPHPDHPDEGHSSYVYTIQYDRRFLVSGSRDQTIRVWDMATQRLLYPPLFGHTASVLCLQFDAAADGDVIVSSGSDRQIIVWRFSTGVKLQTIANAHLDYILNLRFTHTYLVTCSKDHTVKVWSRRAMTPSDPGLPRPPPPESTSAAGLGHDDDESDQDLDLDDLGPEPTEVDYSEPVKAAHAEMGRRQQSGARAPSLIPIVAPYGLLMTLRGHQSAVNSVQLFENDIVSASGDRTIKIWDIRSGDCVRTIPAHGKGVACVQTDGRRIISGSSDNSVRLFDHATGVELAVLTGHGDLVRTVQSRFSDHPGVTPADYQRQAREAEAEATRLRQQNEYRPAYRLRHELNCPSGAMLPPGGGGTRWARIVSGSYDKRVVVWRRNGQGSWVAGLSLPYGQAVASSLSRRTVSEAPVEPAGSDGAVAGSTTATAATEPTAGSDTPTGGRTFLNWWNNPRTGLPPSPTQPPGPHPHHQRNLNTAINHMNQAQAAAAAEARADTAHGFGEVVHVAQLAMPELLHNTFPHPAGRVHANGSVGGAGGGLRNGSQVGTGVNGQEPIVATARLFKLQFDCHRIFCCSQNPVIVCWDFSMGDEKIQAAANFFDD